MYIYKITNQVNGKMYIGLETGEKFSRWKTHQRNYMNGSKGLYNAMRKYGLENFICEIIDETDDYASLIIKEIFWIDKLNSYGKNGYNNTRGGELAFDFSITELSENEQEQIKKIRSYWSIRVNNERWSKLTENERKKFSNKHLHSPEADAKRARTITAEWAAMDEKTRENKLRGLKTQWGERTLEEKHKITSRGGDLFTPKKWKIIWKNGDIEIVENGLSQFCRDQGLIPQNVRGYANSNKLYKSMFKVYKI